MDEKLKATIQKIQLLAAQNPEFESEMRALFGGKANAILNDDKRLDDIYEYCIQKIIKKQAEDFYKNFILNSLTPLLISDYVRMEDFRRKDNFGDFCLAVYQQIEAITNTVCNNHKLLIITEKMWAYPAFIKNKFELNNVDPTISDRKDSNYSIADLIFGKGKAFERSKTSLPNLCAMDKIRVVVYFLGFKAMLVNSFETFVEITDSINDIYQCRNLNHRGNVPTDFEKKVINRVLNAKSFYYHKFLGLLAQYIEYVNNGFENMETNIFNYANTLQEKKVEPVATGPKILGSMDVSKYKKSFK